jgi:hypothetical protein
VQQKRLCGPPAELSKEFRRNSELLDIQKYGKIIYIYVKGFTAQGPIGMLLRLSLIIFRP